MYPLMSQKNYQVKGGLRNAAIPTPHSDVHSTPATQANFTIMSGSESPKTDLQSYVRSLFVMVDLPPTAFIMLVVPQ
jgi:hypothetical protein